MPIGMFTDGWFSRPAAFTSSSAISYFVHGQDPFSFSFSCFKSLPFYFMPSFFKVKFYNSVSGRHYIQQNLVNDVGEKGHMLLGNTGSSQRGKIYFLQDFQVGLY